MDIFYEPMFLLIDSIARIIKHPSKQQVIVYILILFFGLICFLIFFLNKNKKNDENEPQKGEILPNNLPKSDVNISFAKDNGSSVTHPSIGKSETDSLIVSKEPIVIKTGHTAKEPIEKQIEIETKVESKVGEKPIPIDLCEKNPIVNTIAKVDKEKYEIANIPSAPSTKDKKRIGYQPYNYPQPEPICYPIVMMPKSGSVLAIAMEGRSGRKGYKEADFKKYLTNYFSEDLQISDNRIIPIEGSAIPYSPDFTLGYWGGA
jgi:hypothetical protein